MKRLMLGGFQHLMVEDTGSHPWKDCIYVLYDEMEKSGFALVQLL